MPRKLFVAGNWKMNTSLTEAVELAGRLKQTIGGIDAVDTGVAPPFVYLREIAETLSGSAIQVGAQNMYCEDNGAYTGEISARMLKDVGCRYVILGHSERRHVIGETDELINRKVIKALADGLDVILCIGELLEQREAGRTHEVVATQVKIALEGVPRVCDAGQSISDRLTLAYEPVWAIGTGKTATADQAQEVQAMVRKLLADIYDASIADSMRIQYGGSVKPANAAELLAQADVDGALVGGASLKADDFAAIVEAGVGVAK